MAGGIQAGGGREEIDIEALLVRAYREKQVDRLGGGAAARGALGLLGGPKAPGGALGGGEKVDTSSFAARMAARMRELEMRVKAAPDALLTLHDRVLALPDFFAEVSGLEFVVWDLETALRMGHLLDLDRERPTIVAQRHVPARGDTPERWVAAGAPRRVTRIVPAALLVVHGRDAMRPEVSPVEVARMRPIYSGEHRKVTGHVAEYVTALEEVALERAAYAVWHHALVELAAGCADLPGYAVTGPRAPAAPWDEGRRILLRGAAVTDLRDDLELSRKPRKSRKKSAQKAPETAAV